MAVSLVSTGVQFPDATIQTTAATAGAAPGLVLITTITPSAQADLSALSSFSSTYDNYLIVATGLLAANNSPVLTMTVGVGGTAQTGSVYNFTNATNAVGGGTQASATNIILSLNTRSAASGDSTRPLSMYLYIYDVNSTSRVKYITATANHYNPDNGTFVGYATSGVYTVATNVVSGVRFRWGSNENFSAFGALRIYGFKNS